MNLLTKDYDLTKETVVKKFLLSLYCKRYYKLNKISILYKDYAFRGFPPCSDPFLECQHFVKPCSPLRQGEEQPDKHGGNYNLYIESIRGSLKNIKISILLYRKFDNLNKEV